MRLCVGQKREKWISFASGTLNEINGLICNLTINNPTFVAIINLMFCRYFTTLCAHHSRELDTGIRLETIAIRPERLVRRIGNTIPLVETLIGWISPNLVSKVPFAEHASRISLSPQNLSECYFPSANAIPNAARR